MPFDPSMLRDQAQLGDNNSREAKTMGLEQFVRAIAEGDDEEAKSRLRSLLENKSASSLIGSRADDFKKLLAVPR